MHQIRFRLWSAPGPAGGAHSVPAGGSAGFKGPTSKGRKDGKEGQGEREGRVGERREGRGWEGENGEEKK